MNCLAAPTQRSTLPSYYKRFLQHKDSGKTSHEKSDSVKNVDIKTEQSKPQPVEISQDKPASPPPISPKPVHLINNVPTKMNEAPLPTLPSSPGVVFLESSPLETLPPPPEYTNGETGMVLPPPPDNTVEEVTGKSN